MAVCAKEGDIDFTQLSLEKPVTALVSTVIAIVCTHDGQQLLPAAT